jgi:hypothetical protein
MKIKRIILAATVFLLASSPSFTQDLRIAETKVADLLGRLPAADNATTAGLMKAMTELGEFGIRMICDQIIPAEQETTQRPGLQLSLFEVSVWQTPILRQRPCGRRSALAMPPPKRIMV